MEEKDKRIAELENEVDRLAGLLTDKMMSETLITDLNVKNGLNMSLEGGVARLLAEAFCEQFIDSGAENYLEMSFGSTKRPDMNLVVTLQRVEGKTPHQFRVEAEARAKELEELARQFTTEYAMK